MGAKHSNPKLFFPLTGLQPHRGQPLPVAWKPCYPLVSIDPSGLEKSTGVLKASKPFQWPGNPTNCLNHREDPSGPEFNRILKTSIVTDAREVNGDNVEV